MGGGVSIVYSCTKHESPSTKSRYRGWWASSAVSASQLQCVVPPETAKILAPGGKKAVCMVGIQHVEQPAQKMSNIYLQISAAFSYIILVAPRHVVYHSLARSMSWVPQKRDVLNKHRGSCQRIMPLRNTGEWFSFLLQSATWHEIWTASNVKFMSR